MRFIKPLIIFGAVISTAALGLFAIYGDHTNPPRMTAEDFASQTFQEATRLIADATVAGGAPGAIVHIRHKGVSYSSAAGIANKTTGQPMATDLPLRIGSITKIYTAAVIHRLLVDGRLSLDTRIKDILPAEMLDQVPNTDYATIRQLLLHTSGIPDYYDVQSYLFTDWREPITLERMLPVVRRHEATNPPGASYAYSNTGYLLLAEIAEVVTGISFEELLKQVITEPLGLQSTYYNVFQPVENDIHGYGTYLRPWKDTHGYFEHSGADGGLMASVSDLSLFLEELLIGDGPLRETGKVMLSEFVERDPRRRQGLGIETIQSRSGEEIFGHTGDVFGYQTIAHAYPDRGIIVVAHVNCNCSTLSTSLIANLYRAVYTIDGSITE